MELGVGSGRCHTHSCSVATARESMGGIEIEPVRTLNKEMVMVRDGDDWPRQQRKPTIQA